MRSLYSYLLLATRLTKINKRGLGTRSSPQPRTLYETMDKVIAILGILSGLLMLGAIFSTAKGLPDKSIVKGFNGNKVWGQAEINGVSCTLMFLVNEKQLAMKSTWPSIGLILDISELEVSEVKAFIGSRVKVTSSDFYVNHLFDKLIISNRVARQLRKLSGGKFPYGNV